MYIEDSGHAPPVHGLDVHVPEKQKKQLLRQNALDETGHMNYGTHVKIIDENCSRSLKPYFSNCANFQNSISTTISNSQSLDLITPTQSFETCTSFSDLPSSITPSF
jgi:hypothetical protein